MGLSALLSTSDPTVMPTVAVLDTEMLLAI